MAKKDMAPNAPILMRVFKKESELEVWKQTRSGEYRLLKMFPICRWSGQLGPKAREGDRQAPEGFYWVGARQLNPNSSYHLSFDIGYPNAFDRAHGRTGSFLMVHGSCTSAGCYAMTDEQIEEIYALARDAFAGGQQAFQFQAFPFRMSAENLARHRTDPHIDFWRQLKDGADHFEATLQPPRISVAGGRYAFNASTPEKESLVAARREREKERIGEIVAKGAAAVRTTFADGAQHAIFAALARRGAQLGEVSRPEALAYAGREVVLIPARSQLALAANPPLPPERPNEATLVASAEETTPPSLRLMSGAFPILRAGFTPAIRVALAMAQAR
jgi:murein L,D-transpeptidase YafK